MAHDDLDATQVATILNWADGDDVARLLASPAPSSVDMQWARVSSILEANLGVSFRGATDADIAAAEKGTCPWTDELRDLYRRADPTVEQRGIALMLTERGSTADRSRRCGRSTYPAKKGYLRFRQVWHPGFWCRSRSCTQWPVSPRRRRRTRSTRRCRLWMTDRTGERMDDTSRTAGSTALFVVRFLAGCFIAGAGVAWIREPGMNDVFGGIQIVVGIALVCEAAYKNLRSPRSLH